MNYKRRTILQGSALGLMGAGLARGADPGTTSEFSNGEDATRDGPERCPALESALAELAMTEPYEHAFWGVLAVDLETGETVHARNADRFFAPGSTAKVVTVSAAWDVLGGDHRFRTPIYRTGTVTDGRLDGDLVLVASGDLTMGGRTLPDGQIAYTPIDHTYANVIPGATLTDTDPLAGLKKLAAQVREAGITHIAGDVIIDDRLFEFNETLDPETPLSPILINDNLIDVLVSPTEPGRPAAVTHRPETAAYQVDADVETVEADEESAIDLSIEGDEVIRVSGRIAAGAEPLLRVQQVAEPAAFARTALIEALELAGVDVAASPTGPNPADDLPGDYAAERQVAELVSLPFSEYAELIFKVSHNLGANLLVALLAAEAGSTDVIDGFAVIGEFLTKVDVDTSEVSLSDGRGGAREDYITPRAMVDLLSYWHDTPVAETFATALPILGRDGSLAEVAPNSPAAGHVFAKTGTVAGLDLLNDRIFLTAHTLAGYIDTEDGRRLAFTLFMNHAGVDDIEGVIEIGEQLGDLAALIQQDC